jgi:uncharacterized membrane protein YeaQ/YmgE (transglycosylase-associated protein family)
MTVADMLLWITIGLVGGWATTRLVAGPGGNATRGMAAGLIGALIGGFGTRALPALGNDSLNESLAALAGSLWLGLAGSVVTSRRRRTAAGGASVNDAVHATVATPLTSEGHMLSYGTVRNALVGELLKDAAAHEAGRYDEIGRRFDGIEREFPRGAAPQLTRLRIGLSFWDGWIDARNREWPAGGTIDKGDWPMLARRIASDLAEDHEISDARVGARFDASAGSPAEERVQTLAARLRAV